MDTVNATELKNRLGPVLARAELAPVAIERHGRVVAYLVPARPPGKQGTVDAGSSRPSFDRAAEDRLVRLAASGDFRTSRWKRAGPAELLAGVATMLASQPEFDRPRLLALAERLRPGMSTAAGFGAWLATSPVRPARFLPMVRAALAEKRR